MAQELHIVPLVRWISVLTNNDYSGSLGLNLYKTLRHAYYWGMANYNTSIPLLINHQLQAGLGIGRCLLEGLYTAAERRRCHQII
jgi:hypothetical protein